MSKNLVLVESPSKAKTINKYLGSTYKVEATVGHIRNLPKTKLGVDIENGFIPSLQNIRGKGDLVKRIRALAKKSSKIFIATDPDREGEAIAQDIVDVIAKYTNATIYRVLFHEITKAKVKEAIKNPTEINTHLVTSQRARRVMDRIIGYKLSPFLWTAVIDEANGHSLSAGRVQSVAVRLICEREDLIAQFIPTEYWSIIADFETEKQNIISAKLYSVNNKPVKLKPKPELSSEERKEFEKNNFIIDSEKIASEITSQIKSKNNFNISEITKKETRRNPNPPFITSTMQAEASRKLRLRPRKTMQLAQNLYEGIDLGDDGTVGLITYMRTDSTRLNEEIVNDVREFIGNTFGKKYKPEKPKIYIKKKSNIQDAHEAIRPTSVKYTPEFVKPYLSKEQFELYSLIWKRFVASQMESAILETTTISFSAEPFIFKANGTIVKFKGFLALYEETNEDNSNSEIEDVILPNDLSKNQLVKLKELEQKQHFTKPPARYTESSLIKELEENGIGRPSTYASIIGTIQDRDYVKQKDRKFFPTSLGKKVNEILVKNFSKIVGINYSAEMETELDNIAEGEKKYVEVLEHFYNPFIENLKQVEKNIEKIKCDKCGADMEIKIGRFGRFLACTNYPDCKNIKPLNAAKKEKTEPEFTGETCPECGAKLMIRNSRYGKFIGCENYPECKYTKQITLDIKCPKCKTGDIVTRKTKRGRTFFGCSNYPECDFSSWTIPKSDTDEK